MLVHGMPAGGVVVLGTGNPVTDLFPTAMAFVWRPENDGQPLHLSANDPGGSTSWGVTFTTWAGWQRLHNAPVSMEAFTACVQSDFLPLYRAMFWNASRCGNMGPIGIQVFDIAMGSGPGSAARFLQTILGVEVDGEIGPLTIAALNNAAPAAINFALCNERERFYAALPTAKYFARGWDRRAEGCRDLVASMIGTPVPAAPESLSQFMTKTNPAPAGQPIKTENPTQ